MKLLVSTLFLAFGLSASMMAQEETRLGAFLGYGTEIENVGLGVNAEFPVADDLTISPSFLYYFPKEELGIKINWFEVNANVNYYLLNEEGFGLYGLGGLNYSSVSVKTDFGETGFGDFGPTGEVKASDGRFGLNLGAGANLELGGSITPFAEIKYVIIDGGQLVALAGVKINI